jgi:cytochrome c
MLNRGKYAVVACVLSLGAAGSAVAQATLKYTGCADITQANFTKVVVVDKTKDANMDEIIRFAVAKNGDVYYAERAGNIKVAKNGGAVVKIGHVDVYPPTEKLNKPASAVYNNVNNELGLVGLALDNDFETNHFIYVNYQAHTVNEARISRFTVNADVLDMASEKILVKWEIQKDYCCHTGGDLTMDAKGDLWSTIGNNTMNRNNDNDALAYVDESIAGANDQGHAANSNDLRGKLIRIHPNADGTASIPAGNFKDYFKSMYTADELAKIKPEIYAMGMRNPYTVAVDNVKGWAAWGDVGPDIGKATEEWNLITKPGFMGWPFFAGAEGNPNYSFRLSKDPAAPTNTSKDNTGVQKLPPAQGAAIGYNEAAAMTGPIYRWSAAQTGAKKLPGHFDGKWLVTDWLTKIGIKVISLDDAGKVTANVTFFDGNWASNPLGLKTSPDGTLYLLEYNSGYRFASGGVTPTIGPGQGPMKISRIEYTGAACGTTSIADKQASEKFAKANAMVNVGLAGNRFVSIPMGTRGFSMYDLQGKSVWSVSNIEGNASRLEVPSSVGNGLYRVRYEF